MTKQIRIALPLLLATALGGTSAAQTSPGQFSEAPFDSSLDRLEPGFKGNDLERLATALAKLRTTKDEFESSAQYEDRMAKLGSATLYGRLSTSSTFSSVIPAYVTYDADKEVFKVDFFSIFAFGLLQGLSNPDDSTLNLMLPSYSVVKKDLGSYTGENAFGATARIHKTEIRSTNLYVMNPTNSGFTVVHSGQSFEVPCKAEDAKVVKDQLRVLAVFRAKAPFLGSCLKPETPTVDHPYETTTYYKLVGAVLDGFEIYNIKTGVVYVKPKHVGG